MTKIRSISITDKQNAFLEEHTYISISQIAQNAIDKAIEEVNSSFTTLENKTLRERIDGIMKTIHGFRDFVDKKGLMDEYLKEVAKT